MTKVEKLIEQIMLAKNPGEMLAIIKEAGYNNFNVKPQEIRDAEQVMWDKFWSVNQFNLPGMNIPWEQQYIGLVRSARTLEHCKMISETFDIYLRSLPKTRKSELIRLLNNKRQDIRMEICGAVKFEVAKSIHDGFEHKQMLARTVNKNI